nr:MAG TPA: hypothetical protein [Caudoviricetes sp.]
MSGVSHLQSIAGTGVSRETTPDPDTQHQDT